MVAGLVHLIVLGTSKSIDGLTTASGPLIMAQTLSIAAVGFLAVTYDLFPERTTEPAPTSRS